MECSVIIPTHNRCAVLQRTLEALGRQVCQRGFEIIVADDGSSDETAATVWSLQEAFPVPLHYLYQTNRKQGCARNLGVEHAAGDWIVFLGDDTVPEERFLAEHMACHARWEADPSRSRIVSIGYTTWPQGLQVTRFLSYIGEEGWQFGFSLIQDPDDVPFNYFYTSNLSMSRSFFQAAGGFDEDFQQYGWEDIELSVRLKERGMRIVFTPAAVTHHHHTINTGSFLKRQRQVGRSAWKFYEKHPEIASFLGTEEIRRYSRTERWKMSLLTVLCRLTERWSVPDLSAFYPDLLTYHYRLGLLDEWDPLRIPIPPPRQLSPPEQEITVVVPTWNRAHLLRQCLLTLRHQTVPCRILVVDNGSTDGTSEMLETEFPEADHIVLERNEGFARAVNQGLRRVSTPYVALLNNDAEAAPDWIERGLEALRNRPDYAFFASKMLNHRSRDRMDGAGDCYDARGLPYKRGFGKPASEFRLESEVLGASGGAAFYRTDLFREVGGFDEDYYMYLEDVDLSLRAQLHGHRCLYLPDAVVYHIEAGSDDARTLESCADLATQGFYSPRRVFWITRNRWLLMMTYQPWSNAPRLGYAWVKSFLFHLLRAGYLPQFLRGVLHGLKWSPVALRKRSRLRKTRTREWKELCQPLQQS